MGSIPNSADTLYRGFRKNTTITLVTSTVSIGPVIFVHKPYKFRLQFGYCQEHKCFLFDVNVIVSNNGQF